MASYGRPTSFPPKHNKIGGRENSNAQWNWLRLIVRMIVVTLWLASVAACASTVEYGVKPKTDALASLKAAESTKKDVRLLLGEPRGRGMARISQDPAPRDLWFYEYVRSDGQTIDLKMLIVLFKDDIYDGHFWFSSVDVNQFME